MLQYQFKRQVVADNVPDANFGGNFRFWFKAPYNGVVYMHQPQLAGPLTLPTVPDVTNSVTTIPTRYTIDTSAANLSSIITTWSQPDNNNNINVVLTGDSVGYRVLQVVGGKTIGVFQVPHHGSARNSLPFEYDALPPNSDVNFIKGVLTFWFILSYNYHNLTWLQITKEVHRSFYKLSIFSVLGMKLKEILSILQPSLEQVLKNILNIDNPKYFYHHSVVPIVNIIKQNVKDYKAGKLNVAQVFSLNVDKRNWKCLMKKTSFANIYLEVAKCLSIKQGKKTYGYAFSDFCTYFPRYYNPFLDDIIEHQIQQFYKSFQARLYYISTVETTSYSHPHQCLLNGLLKALVDMQKQCTILLSSGSILSAKSLPSNAWNNYVTIKYLSTSGHASINSVDGTVTGTKTYYPNVTDTGKLIRIRKCLFNGSTAQFFKKNMIIPRQSNYIIVAGNSFLSIQNNSLVLCNVQVTMNARCFVVNDGDVLVLDCQGAKFMCYIERLTANADRYYFYEVENQSRKYFLDNQTWDYKNQNHSRVVFNFIQRNQALASDATDGAWNEVLCSPLSSERISKIADSKEKPLQSQQNLTLKEYIAMLRKSYPSKGIVLKTLLSLMVCPDISDQIMITASRQLNKDILSLVKQFFQYIVNETTHIMITDGEVAFSEIVLNLPEHPPSMQGHGLVQVYVNYSNPKGGKSLLVCHTRSEKEESRIDFTPFIDLSEQSIYLSSYLMHLNYPTGISECSFSDIVMLLLGGMATGSTAYMALPPSLAAEIVNWKVYSDDRSVVKVKTVLGSKLLQSATICAIPDATSNSLSFGPFQISLQELSAIYTAPSLVMMYSGVATISYKSASKQASFMTVQNLNTTAEVNFTLTDLSMTDFLSFLQLDGSLAAIHIPILGGLLKKIVVDKVGFTLKQSVHDTSDLHLQSLFFEASQANIGQFLPSAVKSSEFTAKVSIFNPLESTPMVGIDASFYADVHNSSQAFKLTCSFSILPVITTAVASETGYVCTCAMSTSNTDCRGCASLTSLMAIFGLENAFQALSTSVPVLAPVLNDITLQEVSLTYNSSSVSSIDMFHISLLIPYWKIVGSLSIEDFEVDLQFSKESGWSAFIQGNVQFGLLPVSVEFKLPTSTTPGSIAFENCHEDQLTVNKLVGYMGLSKLSEVPILGSILDITVVNAMLGLQTERDGGLSLYGFKVGVHLDSADLKVFTLSNVNATVGYSRSDSDFEISFNVTGCINKKAYLEVMYDPSTEDLTGRVIVHTNSVLSVNECVGILTSLTDLSDNITYATISNDNSVDIVLKLKYQKPKKSIFVQQFSISLSTELSFGQVTLKRLQLVYKNSLDNDAHIENAPNNLILPTGSSMHLLAILEDEKSNFGLQLSIDCNVKNLDSKQWNAVIVPSPGKSLSLRSFLSLLSAASPPLPDSAASLKPSSDGFLDLELVKGSLTFQSNPSKLVCWEVTTATSGSGWAILTDPNVILKDLYLCVAYSKDAGISAEVYGSLVVDKVQIQLKGTKKDQLSKFVLVGSPSIKDVMSIVHSVSPSSKQNTTISSQAGLPEQLKGSMALFSLKISKESIFLDLNLNVDLSKWTVDLGFTKFLATDLHLILSWKREFGEMASTKYLLKISALLNFGSIAANVELEIGSQTDTLLQATLNPEKIDLKTITDHTLRFLPSTPPDGNHREDSHLSFSDLLPDKIVPFEFITGYLQLNLTRKLCLVYGSVKNLGSCLLVAGNIEANKPRIG